jgi:membrane protein required for colicin V production
MPIAEGYFSSKTVATGVTIGSIFLLTLLIVSIITVRISDMILDSRVGALDRSLGFLFGLGRGLIIVVVAFLFFAWLVPDRSQPEWVRGAKSRVVLQSTGQWLMSMLPDDPESTILKRLKRPKPEDQDAPPDAAPGQKSELQPPPTLARLTQEAR